MKEIWKPLNCEYHNCKLNEWESECIYHIRPNKYEISNTGKVRNMNTKKEYTVVFGRITVDVCDFGYYGRKYGRCIFPVTRLVYSTFIRPLKSDERVYKVESNISTKNISVKLNYDEN